MKNNGHPKIEIDDLMENIRLLNKKRGDLYSLLEKNGEALISSLRLLFDQKFGVREGSIVESAGEEYRVTAVIVRADHDPEGKPWVSGNPRRRGNGEFGTTVKNLYSNWELKTK